MINSDIPDIQAWISRFQNGNPAAFREVFDLYGNNLFFYVKTVLRDSEAASHIVAKSFIKLWKERKSFDQLKSIKEYLYLTTRRACVEHLENEDHNIILHSELAYAENGTQGDALNRIIYGDILKIIFDEIENLPEPTRMVFKMTYVERLSLTEIAIKLGMTRQDTNKNKKRALELIRTSLAEQNFLLSLALLEVICYAKMNHII